MARPKKIKANRSSPKQRAVQKRLAEARKACSAAGKKPFTKGFGACMSSEMAKRKRASK